MKILLTALTLILTSTSAMADYYYEGRNDFPNGVSAYAKPAVYSEAQQKITHYFAADTNLDGLCVFLGKSKMILFQSEKAGLRHDQALIKFNADHSMVFEYTTSVISIVTSIHCQ